MPFCPALIQPLLYLLSVVKTGSVPSGCHQQWVHVDKSSHYDISTSTRTEDALIINPLVCNQLRINQPVTLSQPICALLSYFKGTAAYSIDLHPVVNSTEWTDKAVNTMMDFTLTIGYLSISIMIVFTYSGKYLWCATKYIYSSTWLHLRYLCFTWVFQYYNILYISEGNTLLLLHLFHSYICFVDPGFTYKQFIEYGALL